MYTMDKISLEVTSDESPIRFRDCFSVRYIQSAAVLSQLAYALEKTYRDAESVPEDCLLRHEAFSLNAILSSVAFLESTINELHADAADGAYFYPDGETEALLRTIGEEWKNEKNFDRAPLVTKFQKILDIAQKSPFADTDPAFFNVRNVIEMRNHLLHYKREWVVIEGGHTSARNEETAGEKFGTLLRIRFAPNPFADKNLPFFPYQCLGHGCAEWAVLNSLIFTDAFFRRIGLPAPYEAVRDEILTR